MTRFDVRGVAVTAFLGAVLLNVASPAAATTCSDPVFENAAIAALEQRNEAIGEAYVENYASAKADAFIGWRTAVNAPVPCNAHLRKVRTHLVRSLGALWLSYSARAAGDIAGGLVLLVASSKEAVLANTAVAEAVRADQARTTPRMYAPPHA